MRQQRRFHIIFWSFVVLGFVLLLGNSSPVVADIGGSNVTFAPGAGGIGASCYIPNRANQKLCFSLDSITPDGEDTAAVFMKFPDDWAVGQLGTQVISQSCTNGGTVSGLSQADGPYGRQVDDGRIQNSPDHCTGVYCWNVNTGATNTETVSVPWIWFGANEGAAPHTPCSNDDFYLTFPILGCDEHASTPPASVPICEYVPLSVMPETLPVGLAATYYTQQFTAEDPLGMVLPNDQVSWNFNTGNLPSNCHLWTSTGMLECYSYVNDVPLPAGTYNFTVYVKSINGWADGSRDYTLVINPLLVFDPETLPYGRENQAFSQLITVSDGAEPYTLTHIAGTLPAGLSFDEATDSFTGTPTTAGTYPDIVIQAVDSTGVTKTHTYTLTVLPEHLFTWTPETPSSGENTQFTAVDGFDYYYWMYASQPGGECDAVVWSSTNRFATINFYGKGEHKVCLTMYEYSPPYPIIQDDQLVTVTNSPPEINQIYAYPYPSFPGQFVEAGLYFSDPDDEGNYICEIDWGDGSGDTGTYQLYGQCVFPPHSYNATGSYTLQAIVTDGEGASDTYSTTHQVVYLYAEPNMNLLASNTHPTTVRLRAYALEGTTSLQFTVDTPPLHGILDTPVFQECRALDYEPGTVMCEAEIVYTPSVASPPYVGDDQFTFVVQDTSGHTSDPGYINLWVDDNQAPLAYDGTATVLATEPSDFNIYAFDEDIHDYTFDDVTFFLDTQPEHGTLTIKGVSHSDYRYDSNWNVIGMDWSQLLTYTPDPGSTATTDSFTFHVNDSHQDSNVATVTLDLYTPKTLHVTAADDMVDTEGCTPSHCSLREAVAEAIMGDTIDFTLSLPNTITLTWDGGGELLINRNIHILGPGADLLTISAGFLDPALPEHPSNGFRIFHIFNDEDPVSVSISGLTIRDGRGFEGGGIFVDESAKLDLTDCQIGPNNIVEYAGGGISTDEAVLTMTNCTVIDNHGTGSQGGAGMFLDSSDVIITNSTITGNITNNYGGGILAESWSDVTIIHSTISGNTANQDYADYSEGGGGGIYVRDNSKLTLWNTIVAGNTDLTDPSEHAKWPEVYGAITSLGGNLIGEDTGSTGWLPGDMVGTSIDPIDPLLGTLGVHAPGTTPTLPLLEDSLAIDSVACVAEVTTDQRGVKRPQGIACDRGAFEVENPLTYLFIPLILR